MTVRIKSLVASGPVLVPLSGGATVRLSPGQVSADLHDVEVANNAKVDKLRSQGLIDVAAVEATEADAEPADQPADQPAQAQGGPGGKPGGRSRKRPDQSG